MNEREYTQAVHARRAEFRKDLEALARTWKMLNKCKPPAVPKEKKSQKKRRGEPELTNGKLAAAIDLALREMADEFTTLDMLKALNDNNHEVERSVLNHTLTRMGGEGTKIKIIERGAGRRPTTYRNLLAVKIEAS